MEAGQETKSLVDWDTYIRDFHPDLEPKDVDNVWKWNRTKPLTLAYFIHQLRAKKLVKDFEDLEPSSPFRVIILGGNPEEEENALEFWAEALEKVLNLEAKNRLLDIVMIGPQVSPERHNTSVDLTPRLRLTFYKGRFHDYREDLVDEKKYQDPHMFLAYHSGFHFYIESWTSTLVALFNDGVVGCFTSHDLQDENKQWQWLTGCCDFETLIEPSTNPFRCDRKERKRAYNDRLFAIRGMPNSLYVFASSGPRRLEKGE
jgi:hypothetical protein